MDKLDEAGRMNRASTVWLRIAGSVVGSLVGGTPVGVAVVCLLRSILADPDDPEPSATAAVIIILGCLAFLAGAFVGAPVGATITQKLLRREGSIWSALLGTFVGLLVGLSLILPVSFALSEAFDEGGPLVGELVILGLTVYTPMVAGAVIGSGRKAKPAAKSQGRTRDQDGLTGFT